jgi:hypothetical protein
MGIFSRKVEEKVITYAQIQQIISMINALASQLSTLETNVHSLRGLVNRKLSGEVEETKKAPSPFWGE